MASFQELTTKEKALKINLEPRWYGSFAEIGAGQEIAEYFFKAGGASGTIAKTMSAYDMKFSDAIYGKSKRYVSQERMRTMLDHEYDLLLERLSHREADTCFFTLANTVEALNFRKTNRGHGWMGVRFQVNPQGPPSEVILHMALKDPEFFWQQEAIGILGVNLLYACFYFHDNTDQFLHTLMEGLSSDRVEIDMMRMDGPGFEHVDNRVLSLRLVQAGMTSAAMFDKEGHVIHPSDVLYKKHILVLRGRFRPATLVNLDMLRSGIEQFLEEPEVAEEDMMVLSELTLRNLTAEGKIDEKDFLDRVDLLGSLGQTVLISNYQEYYRLVSYLGQFTRDKKIGLVLGTYNLEQIFDPQYYTDLRGGILEAFGILFGTNIKLYIYPALIKGASDLYTCENFQLVPEMQHLFRYLFATNKIEDISGDSNLLHITSDQALLLLKSGNDDWEKMVPAEVVEAIKQQHLFGYQE